MSFVSVTQQFNTTTSMGRLTLNVLLSFAQFEREVTSERIRDKIAASKRKGLWVGGMAPLGYDTKDRKITVNEAEAERVRTIFRSYLKLGSLNLLMADLRKRGIVTKVRTLKTGQTVGGIPFTRGPLAYLLRNRFYIGEVDFKGEILPGEQPAIVDRNLFDAVQAKLNEQVNNHKASRTKSEALLLGRIFDDRGNRMTPSHARKRGIKYRYYISSALVQGQAEQAGTVSRVPADEIEALVVKSVRGHLNASTEIEDAALIHDHVVRVEVQSDQLVIELANAKGAGRKRKQRRNVIEVPWRKTPSTRRREDSRSRICAASRHPPDPFREPRAPGRIDRARTPLARRTDRRSRCDNRKHRRTRGLHYAEGQHDDLACLPRARSRQGGHRWTAAARHGRGAARRTARRMVPPAPDAWPACAVKLPTTGSVFLRSEKNHAQERKSSMIMRLPGAYPTRCRGVVHNGIVSMFAISTKKSSSLYEQTKSALAQVDANLAEVGTIKGRILTALVFITDMAQKDEMNRAWDEWADRANPPMRACVACGLTGDLLVEIVLTAAI